MSDRLEFRVTWLARDYGSTVEREAFGEVEIRWGDIVLTTLEDCAAATVRPVARLSVLHLATWLTSNWWRLRWEPQPSIPDADWNLSHRLGSAGGGFLWPDLAFVSDGQSVAFYLQDTSSTDEPIRYLRHVDGLVSAEMFERSVDELLEMLLGRLTARRVAADDLAGLWAEIKSERQDPERYTLRKREALLGLDPDVIDAGGVESIHEQGAWMGEAALDEAIASARLPAITTTIAQLKELSTNQSLPVFDLSAFDEAAKTWRSVASKALPSWNRGSDLARVVRRAIGLSVDQPVSSDRLAQVLGQDVTAVQSHGSEMAAAFRSAATPKQLRCFLNRHHPTSRRFEAVRIIADALDAPPDDSVLPVTECATARQKVQRSFAQEFLCPTEALRSLQLPHPSAKSIEELAERYEVSDFTVRSALVNHKLVDRRYLP